MIEMLNIFFDKGLEKIEEKKKIINHIEDKPGVILTDLFDPTLECPEKDFPFLLLQEHGIQVVGATIQYEEFQKFLVQKLDSFFKGFDKQLSVAIEKDSKYPTEFYLSYKIANEQYNLLVFNIYKHTVKDVHVIYERQLTNYMSARSNSEYNIHCAKSKLKELELEEELIKNKNKSFKTRLKTLGGIDNAINNILEQKKELEDTIQASTTSLVYTSKICKEISEGREALENKAQIYLGKFLKDFNYSHVL